MDNYTVYTNGAELKNASLIILQDEGRQRRNVALSGDMLMGRSYNNFFTDIEFEEECKIVSRKHGMFIYNYDTDGYLYKDIGSTNGTYHNGRRLEPNIAIELQDGDTLRIDGDNLNSVDKKSIIIIYVLGYSHNNNKWKGIKLNNKDISIGRDMRNTIYLSDAHISRRNAEITKVGGGWLLNNLSSTNRVIFNGNYLDSNEKVSLSVGDVFKISSAIFIYLGDEIIYNRKNIEGKKLSINIRYKSVPGTMLRRKVLLKNIALDVECGDMVLVLGGSGAGKTTFMNVVVGNDVSKRGVSCDVRLGDYDIYKNYTEISDKIGFVPQFPVVRECEKVKDVVANAAKMKLPKSCTKKEIREKVDEVLETLGILEHRNKMFKQLSGGQQKRVSIAMALVSDPDLFFLDEPDSGLDGSTARKLMEDLDHLSSMGKNVMVISHAPNNAEDLFTKVIVLAKSSEKIGRLAFYGDVSDTRKFFGVEHLQDIMWKINSIEEGGEGRADEFIEKYRRLHSGE